MSYTHDHTIEHLPIDTILPYPLNAKKHPKKTREAWQRAISMAVRI